MNISRLNRYAPVLVRLTIAAVLLWFGINQSMHPEMWTRVVPAWGAGLFGSAAAAVHFNAWFEVILAALLLLGIQTRILGLIAAIHIGVIASGFGFFNPTGARDFGLALAALSISLAGADAWTLDRYISSRRASPVSNQ